MRKKSMSILGKEELFVGKDYSAIHKTIMLFIKYPCYNLQEVRRALLHSTFIKKT